MCSLKGVTTPYVHSARAIDFAPAQRLKINNVLFGKYEPKAGDYVVKSRIGGNHVDCVIEHLTSTQYIVIGGNVSDKVTIRVVDLRAYDYITPVM